MVSEASEIRMETSVPYPTMDWTSDNLKEARTRFKNHATLMFEGPLSEKLKKSSAPSY